METTDYNVNYEGDKGDLLHFAATMTGLIYDSSISDGIEYLMEERIIDDLSGWAGDYQQTIITDIVPYSDCYLDYDRMYEFAYATFFSIDSAFSYEDLYADVDAFNINQYISSSQRVSDVMAYYFSELIDTRFELFNPNINISNVDRYSQKRYFTIIWPIYGNRYLFYNRGEYDVGILNDVQIYAIMNACKFRSDGTLIPLTAA